MAQCMKRVAQTDHHDDEWTTEERNLLSVAFSQRMGSARTSWRIIGFLEEKEEDICRCEMIGTYRKRLEDEMTDLCNELVEILDGYLIPHSQSDECKVVFYRMKADYYRYLAEFTTGEEFAEKSLEAYTTATEFAQNLATTDPIRLGLALNLSAFYFEILKSPQRACQVAKKAFDDAIADLDSLTEESYKDSTLILQLLRDSRSDMYE